MNPIDRWQQRTIRNLQDQIRALHRALDAAATVTDTHQTQIHGLSQHLDHHDARIETHAIHLGALHSDLTTLDRRTVETATAGLGFLVCLQTLANRIETLSANRVADRDRAYRLLRHYHKTTWEAAGLRWDADCDAELQDLVDALAANTT